MAAFASEINVFEDAETFLAEYQDSGIYTANANNRMVDNDVKLLYYLLYSKYGNSAIANWDETQFKYKVFMLMFQYGPTWVKRLDIQHTLRGLSADDLRAGGVAINAHAYAMGDDNVVADTDPTKIDQKSSTTYKKSVIEGYGLLINLLETDVTAEFLNRFKPLFATFVYTRPDIFVTELEEEEEED